MRSDLIFGALSHVKNRYQLCQLTAIATRKLHKTSIRVEDTTNDVLTRFRQSDPAARSVSAETGSVTHSLTSSVQQHRAA